jgi:hypothetical protein
MDGGRRRRRARGVDESVPSGQLPAARQHPARDLPGRRGILPERQGVQHLVDEGRLVSRWLPRRAWALSAAEQTNTTKLPGAVKASTPSASHRSFREPS